MLNFLKKKESNQKLIRGSKIIDNIDTYEELEVIKKTIKTIEKPKICCIDIEESDINELKKQGFNLESGTLGSKVKVPNNNQKDWTMVLPNANFPSNLHEFDITILDLNNDKIVDYKQNEHYRDEHTGKSFTVLHSAYPETIFNPKPIGSKFLKESLNKLENKEHLIIVFSSENYEVEYQKLEIRERSNTLTDTFISNIYSFNNSIPLNSLKNGKEVIVCDDVNIKLKDFLSKYINQMSYSQTFYHPTDYNNNKRENYVPILKSVNGNIVSYIKVDDNIPMIFFPQVKDKAKFLNEFLFDIAPSLFPNLFPYSTVNEWTNEKEYWLPNHKKLQEEQALLISEYEEKLKKKQSEIDVNLNKFSFLHKLLTETGDELVNNIIQFFQWLEFENIVNMDDTQEEGQVLEEDIQIQINKGLLVIECKGIGGTSKDSECSQVSKIKYRRAEERGTFDVFALYIVNHQRHKAPLLRKNPPFTKEQKEDAKRERRGLVTTWQLYNLYFDIELGILNKEKAREILLDYGLIDFKKGLIFVDTVKEVFLNNTVCIVNISNMELSVGDILFVEKNEKYYKVTILDIQKDGKSIKIANNGEFGLKLDSTIKKNSKIWKNGNNS